jgi:hypothetical protein
MPKIEGFNFSLNQGSYWQYGWTVKTNSWVAGSNPISTTTTGTGTVTLGTPTTIQGVVAYPITVAGAFPSGISLSWKYIAITNSRIMGSNDGSTRVDIFNAWTGANAGGGFFVPYPSTQISGAYRSAMSTTYYSNANTYALGQFSNSGGGTYFPDIGTIYSGDPTSVAKTEFFAPGIGPVGFTYHYSQSGSDYAVSADEWMGLTATSFTAH